MDSNLVGPQLPAHIIAKRKRAAEEASALLAANTPTNTTPTTTTTTTPEDASIAQKKKRIAGPAAPPAPLDERPTRDPSPHDNNSDDSSSDDDFGPSVPKAARTEEEEEREAQRRLARFQPAAKPVDDGKPKRDEWMIVPPKSEDWSTKVDPTKIKNRKFQTGKGAKAPQKAGADNTLWTETPDEKRQRLEDEVMGVKKPATQGPASSRENLNSAEARETARRIKEYNDHNRNTSLYDEHKATARIEEDDPSKRAFDREKDIAGARKINHTQKKEMLTRAADFGSRFSSGSYL